MLTNKLRGLSKEVHINYCSLLNGSIVNDSPKFQLRFCGEKQSQFIRVLYNAVRNMRALSFGLLRGQSGSGSIAEKSSLACLSHTRKFSNLRGMHEKVVMGY